MQQQTLTSATLFKRILLFAQPFYRPLVAVLLAIATMTILDALSSWCLSRVFDSIQHSGLSTANQYGAYAFIAIALALVLVRIIAVGYRGRVETRKIDTLIQNHLNHESIAKFFSFSIGQHVNEHSGVKQTIVNNGINSIINQINLMVDQLIPSMVQFLVSIGVLFWVNWVMGVIFLIIGVLFWMRMYTFNTLLIPGVRKYRERRQENARLISEMYRLVEAIKVDSQELRSLDDVRTAQDKLQVIYQDTWLPAINRLQIVRVSTSLLRYGALFLAIWLLFHHQMTLGAIFLCFTWSSTFIASLWEIMNLHKQFLLDRVNIEKYFDLLEIRSDIVIANNPITIEKINGAVEFRNVTFRYPRRVQSYEEGIGEEMQDDPVLKNVSFVVRPGQKIGIVGESGSGKSTLANLLRRAFDPQEGQVLIDGNDVRLLDPKTFLRHVGSVSQEVVMFDRSIRANILFGLEQPTLISEERMHELARLARIDAFFSRLEHGFDTMIGEKGVKLSGGERQRVGIARALAKDPDLLIFDEATSALDTMSERIVQQSIDEACEGKTAIIIAHRLSTVRNCDKILVFRHGILLAEGTHDELLDTCEHYTELIRHQLTA